MKLPSIVFAALVATLGFASFAASAAPEKLMTVADLYKNKAALAGKTIRAQGKVVKANNGIKGYNFIHLQDGTGAAGTNDLTVRTKGTANVGDQVTISGVAVVDKDFGSGYFYPLIIEDATVAPKK